MPRAQDARERPACDPQGCGECRKGARSARDLIQENADPTARSDLERWLNRLVPEHDSLYQHTLEGADDMPAHTIHRDVASVAKAPGAPATQGGADGGQPEYSHRRWPARARHLAGDLPVGTPAPAGPARGGGAFGGLIQRGRLVHLHTGIHPLPNPSSLKGEGLARGPFLALSMVADLGCATLNLKNRPVRLPLPPRERAGVRGALRPSR